MILAPTKPLHQVGTTQRRRSADEIAIRDAVEAWGRERWPDARIFHELAVDRGTSRCDVAFVTPGHIASIEIKSAYDVTARLLQQVSLFRLATPEVWVVTASKHRRDVSLIRYLLPTVGVAVAGGHSLRGLRLIRITHGRPDDTRRRVSASIRASSSAMLNGFVT